MSDAAPLIRSLYARWQRLEQAKAEVAEDLKELFAEAKGRGLETKALRAAFRAKAASEKRTDADDALEALVDAYLGALDGAATALARVTRATRDAREEELRPDSTATVPAVESAFHAPAGSATEEIPSTDHQSPPPAASARSDGNRLDEHASDPDAGVGMRSSADVLDGKSEEVADGSAGSERRHTVRPAGSSEVDTTLPSFLRRAAPAAEVRP